MNKRFILFAMVVVAGIYIYQRTMKFISKLDYTIDSFKFNLNKSIQSNFSKIFFDVKTSLINPENVKVKIKGIQIYFAVNNKTFAQISTFDPFFIEPKKTMPITFPLELYLQSVPKAISDLFKNFISGKVEVQIFGKVDTELGIINFNQTKKLI